MGEPACDVRANVTANARLGGHLRRSAQEMFSVEREHYEPDITVRNPHAQDDRAELAGAGRLNGVRLKSATKPILEINPRHDIIVALASLGDDDQGFKQDSAHLLLDEARVLDGHRPADARLFSDRLARVLTRSIGKPAK
jgi:HSP90 family molecular chaperone